MSNAPLTEAHLNESLPEGAKAFDSLLSFAESLEIKYNEVKAKLEVHENSLQLVDESLSKAFCKDFTFNYDGTRKSIDYIVNHLIGIIDLFHKIEDLHREIKSEKDERFYQICVRAGKAEGELLTLANGDKLPEDASNNALIIQDYINKLKKNK